MKRSEKKEGGKQVKKAIVSGLIAVFVMSLVVVLVVPAVSATWWDASWDNKRELKINNTGGDALSYYQVYVNLSSTPINETSLRVVNETADATVPHWSENITGGLCYGVWFNMSNIPVVSWVNSTYYIYYTNPSVSSTSNGTLVFKVFDDFEDDLVGNWISQTGTPEYNATDQYWGVSQSMKLLVGNIAKIQANESNNIAIRWQGRKEDASSLIGRQTNNANDYSVALRASTTEDIQYYDIAWQTVGTMSANTWGLYELADFNWTLHTNDIYFNNAQLGNDVGMESWVTPFGANFAVFSTEGGEAWIDNFIVRSYTSPEPDVALGGEESGVPVLNLISKDLLPVSSYTTDNLTVWCNASSPSGQLVCYVQMYNNSQAYGSVHSTNVNNNTNTNFYNLSSGVTQKGQSWKAQVWAGNGTSNTTKENTSTRTILNTPPRYTLNSPINGATGVSINPELNLTVTDIDNDTMNVTFYENGTATIAYVTNITGPSVLCGNSTVHPACVGIPRMTYNEPTNQLWMIGLQDDSGANVRTVGCLYNATTLETLQECKILSPDGYVCPTSIVDFSNTSIQNWYIFTCNYSGDMNLYSLNSTGTFENISFANASLIDTVSVTGGVFPYLHNNSYNDIWIVYAKNNTHINRIKFNKTSQTYSVIKTLSSTSIVPNFLLLSKLTDKYIITYGTDHSDGQKYIESTDGETWSPEKTMMTGNKQYSSHFIKKEGLIIGQSEEDGYTGYRYWRGTSIDNLVKFDNYSVSDMRENGCVLDLPNNEFYSCYIRWTGVDMRMYVVKMKYYHDEDHIIGTDTNVVNNTFATTTWTGLNYNTLYEWYATIDDGTDTNTTSVYNFTTQGTDGGAYNITLFTGWNIIGWTDTTSNNAEGLETSIGSNCTYSVAKNMTSGLYESHQHGFSIDNFDVERGWGYYVLVTDETLWERTA